MKKIIFVVSDTIEDKILSSCHSLIAAFFPGKKIQAKLNPKEFFNLKLSINHNQCGNHLYFSFDLFEQNTILTSLNYEIKQSNELESLILPGKESIFQILLKQAVVYFLRTHTKVKPPWGILTGIRPGKLIYRMNHLGIAETTQTKMLEDIYLVDNDKIKLMQSVAESQKLFLMDMKRRSDLAALYISIPFCPSRCYYCSFPSNIVKHSNLEKYIAALAKELELTGEMLKNKGLRINTIYIGGGTPTILSAVQLQFLLESIMRHIPLEDKLEYTVEAGRPDTINQEKISVLQQYGVNRISINPQSMQDYTLQSIGRKHTVADVYESYKQARQNRGWVINMDLILGLPEEGFEEIEDTLNKVLDLRPDNITVHALALKKGSTAWEENYSSESQQYWHEIQKHIHNRIENEGFKPYYFYRQKYIVGNLENVGYALPRTECQYNIAIIEERQNIFGVGAGSVSKIMNYEIDVHKNIYHPVDIKTYMEGYENVHYKIRQALQ